jgi:hypothetical protein
MWILVFGIYECTHECWLFQTVLPSALTFFAIVGMGTLTSPLS